jgi:PAS domain S-box-containing protein
MLHRVAEMIVARIDNISLFQELQNLNRELDRKVEERTRELQESENRFRRLAENAQDVIYRMSLPDGSYEYMSPASTALFGYAPEEFYGSPQLIRTVIHPDWLGYFEEQWSRLLHGDMPPTYEFAIIHKSGDIRWMNQRNILIRGEGGRIIAIEGIVTDITERKRSEEELRKLNEKLEERVRDRTAELENKNRELERMNRLFVGRELKMVELKERIKELEKGPG